MQLKIFKYRALNNHFELHPYTMCAWVLENDWDLLLAEHPSYRDGKEEFFVKIECHNQSEFSDFVIYTRLAKLPDDAIYSRESDGLLWLPQEIMPERDCTTNKRSIVEISIVNPLDIPAADVLTINIPEDEVERWSDKDFEVAEKHLRKQLKLFCFQQKFFYNKTYSDAVVGTITKTSPYNGDDEQPYCINSDTQIVTIGKPANPQQIIDFTQIGGQKKVIDELRRIIQLPMNYPEYFTKFGIKPPKGVLLYGPPGNGKTMIARAVAQSFGAAFIEIDLSDALQKFKGVGEYNLGKKFEEAERKKNAVIFIDEIDAIASIREVDSANHEVSLVGKLLSLMDGIKSSHRVFVIGATNRINAIDPALRRPGRFDKELEVPQPDTEARFDILQKYVKLDKGNLFTDSVNDEYLYELAKKIEGYSGADISALYTETVMSAIRRHLIIDVNGKATMTKEAENIRIDCEDFNSAFDVIKPTQTRLKESTDWKYHTHE